MEGRRQRGRGMRWRGGRWTVVEVGGCVFVAVGNVWGTERYFRGVGAETVHPI